MTDPLWRHIAFAISAFLFLWAVAIPTWPHLRDKLRAEKNSLKEVIRLLQEENDPGLKSLRRIISALGLVAGLLILAISGFFIWQRYDGSDNVTGLTWNDALYIESVFMSVPRPCLVKLKGTNPTSLNSRNILAKIIAEHGACEVADNQTDSRQEFRKDVDQKEAFPIAGLVVRWSSNYAPGEQVFHRLAGNYCPIMEGHAMPDGSPNNLILITVGDGYPWPSLTSCR